MKNFASAASVAAGLASLLLPIATAQDVDPIVIKGTKFFYKTNGTQFYIKGIAYQQDFVSDGAASSGSSSSSNGYTDPLADPDSCRRDLPYLRQLETNTIRVYAIDPTKDHTECMNMFADAGIYVVADLGSPSVSIQSNTPSWTTSIYDRYTSVIDSLANYTNTLGFFAGNEVITQPNTTFAAPFVKAAVRDMKAYIKSKYRPIGVGYAAEDNQYVRDALSAYMNCGENQDDAVDFYGQNVYSWCGDSSFEQSGYNVRVEDYQNYSVPAFFAEYGCNTGSGPRPFTETPVLLGPQMDDVFSGGIVYLYFQEANDYGLVSVDSNSVSTLQDFNNLKTEIASASPSIATSADYSPTNSPRSCPTGWANFSAAASPLPPTPDMSLCECMYNSLGCVVAPDVSEDSYGDLFGYVCGLNDGSCDGITANGTTGTYGQFGMCDSKQQLGYVLNQYYSNQGSSASACSFSGSAVTQAAATPTGSCRDQLSSASSAMTASGGSGGSGGPSTSSGAAAGINTVFHPNGGSTALWIFVQLAIISAVGMVML